MYIRLVKRKVLILLLCFNLFKVNASPFIIEIIWNAIVNNVSGTTDALDALYELTEDIVRYTVRRTVSTSVGSPLFHFGKERINDLEKYHNRQKQIIDDYIEFLREAKITKDRYGYGSLIYADYLDVYRQKQDTAEIPTQPKYRKEGSGNNARWVYDGEERKGNYLGNKETDAYYKYFTPNLTHRFKFLEDDFHHAEKATEVYFNVGRIMLNRIMMYATYGGNIADHQVKRAIEFAERAVDEISAIIDKFNQKKKGFYCVKSFTSVYHSLSEYSLKF